MDNDRRIELATSAIELAVDEKFEQASAVMAEIAAGSINIEMFGVCIVLARAAVASLISVYGQPHPEALWALIAPDPEDGPQHPAHAFSQRFITGYANEDLPSCQALYLAATKASPADFAHSMIALLGDTAVLARYVKSELASHN